MRIYLVRHGESEGNKRKVFQHPKSPLSNDGLKQAEAVAERFNGVKIDVILASPYTRADMTAQAISQKLGVKVEHWDDLHEIKRPSELIGKSIHSSEAKLFEQHLLNSIHNSEASYQGEEGFEDLKTRSQKILNHLVKNHKDQNVLLVSHATTIKTIVFEAIFGENLNSKIFWNIRRHIVTKNTGVTIMEYSKKRGWALVTWGDISHL
jgi:phosphoserine phosphatase